MSVQAACRGFHSTLGYFVRRPSRCDPPETLAAPGDLSGAPGARPREHAAVCRAVRAAQVSLRRANAHVVYLHVCVRARADVRIPTRFPAALLWPPSALREATGCACEPSLNASLMAQGASSTTGGSQWKRKSAHTYRAGRRVGTAANASSVRPTAVPAVCRGTIGARIPKLSEGLSQPPEHTLLFCCDGSLRV